MRRQIRMDCSSPYAMANLVAGKLVPGRIDNDADAAATDRTPSVGL
jgi:hypothetical protein